MTESSEPDVDEFVFPSGLHLLAGWQAGTQPDKDRLRDVFTAAFSGSFDSTFKNPAPRDAVHTSGSVDLLTLGLLNDLFGITAAELYKGDPERYVRSVLTSLKLLGMSKMYLSWPVYAFTAEALGQPMIYSDRFSPGTDPDNMLVTARNPNHWPVLDLTGHIPSIIDETLASYSRLTGFRPVMHLSAPYSLAADIYGHEQLINALTHEPEFVRQLLDHLADAVLEPWIDHFLDNHPDGWIELSDASGSPFFIGPRNCEELAIASTQRLVAQKPWRERVYDANYRGDWVTQARKRDGSSRRRGATTTNNRGPSLTELFEAKNSVCRDFVIRLADDRIPGSFYVEKAIERNVPLFMGIGATQIDRHGVVDLELACDDLRTVANDHVDAIRTVARSIAENGYGSTAPPWPGTVYFEDVSAESDFTLIEVIVGTVLGKGAF
ncbi:MAG: hypothetical protein GY708_22805 [Actinomycetia bacterium]|nr:hypothetical protein [Actinomycetes bacterium]MCP4958584.1 hypothetical protein [Actinomycetes bacterium]